MRSCFDLAQALRCITMNAITNGAATALSVYRHFTLGPAHSRSPTITSSCARCVFALHSNGGSTPHHPKPSRAVNTPFSDGPWPRRPGLVLVLKYDCCSQGADRRGKSSSVHRFPPPPQGLIVPPPQSE